MRNSVGPAPLEMIHPRIAAIVYQLYLQGDHIELIERKLVMLHNVLYEPEQIHSIIDEYNELYDV